MISSKDIRKWRENIYREFWEKGKKNIMRKIYLKNTSNQGKIYAIKKWRDSSLCSSQELAPCTISRLKEKLIKLNI